MNEFSDVLRNLATGPDSQLDACLHERLRAMADADPLPAADVKSMLDDIVYASLASSFVIVVLDTIWKARLKAEGAP